MSYSSLIQTLPEAWRTSSGVAVLSSLGIHLLLLVILPVLSFGSEDIQPDQTVGVVALTPEEQSRVSQFPQNIAPPINGQSEELPPLPAQQPLPSGELPPLPSEQPLPSGELPPLPPPQFLPPPPPLNTATSEYPISSPLPQSPLSAVPVPLPPPPQNQSWISQYPFGSIPAPESPPNIKTQQLPPLPPPNVIAPNSLPSRTGLQPSQPFSPDSQSSPSTQPLNQTQKQVAANPANGQTQPLPAINSLPEKTKQELIAKRNAIRDGLASNKTASSNGDNNQRLAKVLQQRRQQSTSTPPSSTSDNNQRLAKVLQQRRQQSTSTPPSSNGNNNQRLAKALQQRRQQSTSNRPSPLLSPATAQNIAQVDAYKQQFQKVQQAYPNLVTSAPIRAKINTCNKLLNNSVAILAAVISPEGKILSGPNLLSKNRSIEVRLKAIAKAKRYRFPKTTNPTNQPFRFDFTYDSGNCPVTKVSG